MNEISTHTNCLHQLLISEDSLDVEVSENAVDISRICRTCLRETADNDLANEALCVINSNGKLVRVYEMFEAVTGLKIESDDNLPHHLCSACLRSINSAYTFRTQGQRAYEILRSIVDKTKDESGQIFDDSTVEYILEEDEDVGKQLDEAEIMSVRDESVDIVEELDNELLRIEQVEEVSEPEENYDLLPLATSDLTCIFCKMAFPLQRDILQHYKDAHPREKPFKCTECSASFTHIQSARRHKKCHHVGSKEKMCPLCSRLFHRSDDLKRHIRTHTDERPYQCDVCLKAFKQHTELKDHSLSHIDSAMYKCKLCSKEWRSRNGWYLHMKSHQVGKSTPRKPAARTLNVNVTGGVPEGTLIAAT